MSLIDQLIRPDIRALQPYHVQAADGFLKLDAMENPYQLPLRLRAELGLRLADVALNRYPVPTYQSLKERIKTTLGVPAGFDIVLGNGSDELIAMISIACARPGAKVLAPLPGFVMYAMSAQFAGLEFIGVPLQPDMTLDLPAMLTAISEHRPAVTYLAYPNNPTGTLYDAEAMLQILHAVGPHGIVVVDEAYHPFAQTSFMARLPEFDNLVVMRTLSKQGLAGIRLGYMAASAALLTEFEKVRPPYNVNVLTEAAAEFALEHIDLLNQQAATLRQQRTALGAALAELPGVEVFPSAANFLLIRIGGAGKTANVVFADLLARKVLVKNVGKMHPLLDNCLRVTVSTADENAAFLAALGAVLIAAPAATSSAVAASPLP